MTNIKTKTSTLLLLLPGLLGGEVIAENLTLEAFFNDVQQDHPFFKKEALNPKIIKSQRSALLGAEDWRLSATTSFAHEESGLSTALMPEKSNYTNVDLSLNRSVWKTGGQFSVAYATTRSSQDYATGNIKNYQNTVKAQYVHPLMKNVNGILSRLNYDLQNYHVQNAEISNLEARENFLASLGDKFLGWKLQTELVRISQERVTISETEFERSKRKRADNLIPKVDVIRSETALLRARQGLQRAKTDLAVVVRELSVLSNNRKLSSSRPSYDLYRIQRLPSQEIVSQQVELQSRLIKMYEVLLTQQNYQHTGLQNGEKPELNLIASAGLLGSDSDLGSSAAIDKPQYSLALNFNYPLGNRSAKAKLDQSHLRKMQLQEEKMDLILTLQSSAAAILEQLTQLEMTLSLNKEQIARSEQKTKEELRRYNQGRSELTFVLQSRDEEQQAKISHAVTAATYHKVYLQYRALMDELVENNTQNNSNDTLNTNAKDSEGA